MMARFHNFYSLQKVKTEGDFVKKKKAQCVSNSCKDLFLVKKILEGWVHFKMYNEHVQIDDCVFTVIQVLPLPLALSKTSL